MASGTSSTKTATVAILPFQNHSDKNELDYFSLGFTDDLVIALSRFSSLRVISPHSTRNIQVSIDQASDSIEFLNAGFIVTGSFRLHSGKVKIGAQLKSANDSTVIWAERYDEGLEGIFEVQDDIVQRIVSALQKQIRTSMLSASRSKKETNLEAYDYLLRGMAELEIGGIENDETARGYFQIALEKDPNCARAYTGLSLSYFNEWSCRLWERWDESQKGAFKFAKKAVDIDPHDYVALSVLGRIFLYKGEYEKSEHYLRKSLRLNSNDPDTLIQIASCFVYLGYEKESEKLYLKAQELNPVNVEWYFAYGTFIYFELGAIEKSIELAHKVSIESVWVDFSAYVSAAFYHLNDYDNMHKYWNLFLEQFRNKITMGKEPASGQALEWMININPYNTESQLIPFWEHMKGLTPFTRSDNQKSNTLSTNSNVFRKGSGLWEMSYEDKSIFLPDLKGYHDLAMLMSKPEKEFHCTELMGTVVRHNDSTPVMDDKAKASYKNKISDLLAEIEEANEMNDSSRSQGLQEEYEQIVDHLSSSMGLGGKTRKLDSSVERSRSAITWRIRSAIKKIEDAHPSLSKHLTKSIATGTFCSYSPEKPVDWIF